MHELEERVSATDSGITRRGKRILRSSSSRPSRHCTQLVVASQEEGPQDDRRRAAARRSSSPGCAVADVEDLREDDQQHAEEQQRPHQRPHVAEHRAEVAQLEVGVRERQRQDQKRRRSSPNADGPCTRWLPGARSGAGSPHPASRSQPRLRSLGHACDGQLMRRPRLDGSSRIPPLAVPCTTTEAMSSQRDRVRAGALARQRGRQRVAAWASTRFRIETARSPSRRR